MVSDTITDWFKTTDSVCVASINQVSVLCMSNITMLPVSGLPPKLNLCVFFIVAKLDVYYLFVSILYFVFHLLLLHVINSAYIVQQKCFLQLIHFHMLFDASKSCVFYQIESTLYKLMTGTFYFEENATYQNWIK